MGFAPSSVDGMEPTSAARRPAPVLAGLIEQYHGYRLHGYDPGIGLPSRNVTFIVSIGNPIDRPRRPIRANPPTRTGVAPAVCRRHPR